LTDFSEHRIHLALDGASPDAPKKFSVMLEGTSPDVPKIFGSAGALPSRKVVIRHSLAFLPFVHRLKLVAAKTKPAKAG
jgi:hypothetical protein